MALSSLIPTRKATVAPPPPAVSGGLAATGEVISLDDGKVPLSAAEQHDFIVLSQGGRVILGVASQAMGTHRLMSIRARAASLTGHEVVVQEMSVEDIAATYARAPQGQRGRALLPTADERTRSEAMIEEILVEALAQDASDVHIESRVESAMVLFRIHGKRRVFERTYSHEELLSVARVMAFHADAKSKNVTWSPDRVEDFNLEWKTSAGQIIPARFSSSPIHPAGGFHAVLRVLKLTGEGPQLAKAGYTQAQLDLIIDMCATRSGLVLACGATNSGKSTSLQAFLRAILAKRGIAIKAITVEDPVEYTLPGACQVPCARKEGETPETSMFTAALRGALRQDPDVAMVGEVRDQLTAVTLQNFVLGGRKMFSTVHANDAIAAFARLEKIGIELDILCSPGFISGIVYQALAPKLCPECAIPWNQVDQVAFTGSFVKRLEEHVRRHGGTMDALRFEGKGCATCNGTGTKGRVLCAEVLVPDQEFLILMSQRKRIEAKKHWVDHGGKAILDNATPHMLAGLISPVEVEQNITPFPSVRA